MHTTIYDYVLISMIATTVKAIFQTLVAKNIEQRGLFVTINKLVIKNYKLMVK